MGQAERGVKHRSVRFTCRKRLLCIAKVVHQVLFPCAGTGASASTANSGHAEDVGHEVDVPAEVLLDGETVMSDRYAEVTGVPHDAHSQAVLHTQFIALIGIASLPLETSCSFCPLQQAILHFTAVLVKPSSCTQLSPSTAAETQLEALHH